MGGTPCCHTHPSFLVTPYKVIQVPVCLTKEKRKNARSPASLILSKKADGVMKSKAAYKQ